MPPLSPQNQALPLYLALVLAAVSTTATVALAVRLARVRAAYARLLDSAGEGDVLAVVTRQIEAGDRLRHGLDLLGSEVAELRQRMTRLVGTAGLTRYDAFSDMGGQMSYSVALLDGAGDGVVLSAINGRAETRSYAKPVRAGHSTHTLSEEEQAAIAQALGPARAAVPTSA